MPFRFAYRVLSFANGNVEYLFGKLDGIARTFGHDQSMPQSAATFYNTGFQTEALPDVDTPVLKGEDS